MKPTICLDLDGVLANFSLATWTTGTFGPPMTGAVRATKELAERYTLVVLTARGDDELPEIFDWCIEQGMPISAVTNRKPPALAYVDDHAVHHDGNWEKTKLNVDRLWQGLSPAEEVAWEDMEGDK